jgi:succinate dehydrogenase hydrophobic anchor subunit
MSVDVREAAEPVDGKGMAKGSPASGGGWGWVCQVLTGALLLALLGVHLIAQHFVVSTSGGLRNYAQVADYLGDPVILVIESTFLVVVAWHAMLGVRSILFDLGFGPTGRRRITWLVCSIGAATVGYGFWLIAVIAG